MTQPAKRITEKPHDSAKSARRVAYAALAGTAMEWYDYYAEAYFSLDISR